MDSRRKPHLRRMGGTGYLTLMTVFVMVCMAVFAALTFSAASSEKKFSVKNAEFTKKYYAADLEARRTLAEVDGIAAKYTDKTDFMLAEELDSLEKVTYSQSADGLTVSWTTPVSGSRMIYSEVLYSGGNYEIKQWRSVSENAADDKPLNVWNGE